MYYTGTEQECLDYDTEVTLGEKYPVKGDNWANPKKHPTKDLWAILAHDKYLTDLDSVDELPEDWFPIMAQ